MTIDDFLADPLCGILQIIYDAFSALIDFCSAADTIRDPLQQSCQAMASNAIFSRVCDLVNWMVPVYACYQMTVTFCAVFVVYLIILFAYRWIKLHG